MTEKQIKEILNLCNSLNAVAGGLRLKGDKRVADLLARAQGAIMKLTRELQKPQPKTIADQIRCMNDEGLADLINRLITIDDSSELYCKNKQECCDLIDTEDGIPPEWCAQCLLEYLRQPAKEGLPCG